MPKPKPWNCPTCERRVTSPFCPYCGEQESHSRDLTLGGLLRQMVKAFSRLDSQLLRSFRALLGNPGELTLASVRGQRKTYLGPFQLFLLANVLFFTLQSLTGANIFSSPLDSHLSHQDWSVLAQRLVDQRLEATGRTLGGYAPVFDHAVVTRAKSLIVLMTLPFVPLLPVFFRRRELPFVAHAVFTVHLYAFLLLVFCVSLLIAAFDRLRGGAGLESPWLDHTLAVLNLAACFVYLYLATTRVYGGRRWLRLLQALMLTVAVGAIALGYRFALLVITLYST